MRWCGTGRFSAALLAAGAGAGAVVSANAATYAAMVKEAKYGFLSLPAKWLQVRSSERRLSSGTRRWRGSSERAGTGSDTNWHWI